MQYDKVMFSLDTKTVDAICDDWYNSFLDQVFRWETFREAISLWGWYDHRARIEWTQSRSKLFWEETIRESWNHFMLQKNQSCGNLHDLGWGGTSACKKKRENPCCGHPWQNRTFHTLWLWAYLATLKSGHLHNPAPSIRQLVKKDNFAGFFWLYGIRGPLIQSYMQNREKRIWENTINPFRQKIAGILQGN